MGYQRWLAIAWVLGILVMIYIVTRISGVASAFGGKHEDPRQVRPTL
jgi:hypothetical protein